MAAASSTAPMTMMSERGQFCRQETLIGTAAPFRFTFPSYPGLADIVQAAMETRQSRNFFEETQ